MTEAQNIHHGTTRHAGIHNNSSSVGVISVSFILEVLFMKISEADDKGAGLTGETDGNQEMVVKVFCG